MRDPFANYDSWLERPYQDACEAADAFIDWCEDHNIDPEHPDAETLYNDYIDSQYEDYEPDYDGDYDDDEHF